MPDKDPYRLPAQVSPRRYELTLTPDLAAATFAGEVQIDVDVHEPTTEIVLNAIELEIHEARVRFGDDDLAAAVTLDEGSERATLAFEAALPPGQARLSLRFAGTLNDKLRGFYRSKFTDEAGVEHTIATTQFEATDARRAFPCWDEPEHKAVFAITLVVDEGLAAVSNAQVVSDEAGDDGRRRVRFADTMPMSTYLVAFVVGPLEATNAIDVSGTPTRLVHPPGKGHLTPFGLEVAEFSLRYLADYFALPYAGDSMDLVAIPDFAFGAMENVGCVTFRETLLLVDPDTATQNELLNVVDVIAHELAHMWFGNLVTMKWWNGIWLNEAFATFMEMKVTDALRPDWQRWVSFGLSRTTAFDTDALLTTRPIEYPVVSPADAEGMFDVLTYEKGAAVVRMLEQYLGEDRFRSGIRKYMADHRYGNTETTDLWDAIEAATDEPVRRIMDSWIFQAGHPVVTAAVSDDGLDLTITQEQFTYLPPSGEATLWSIPLGLRIGHVDGSVTERAALLEVASTTIEVDSPVAWVVLNGHGHGFYRARYHGSLRDGLLTTAAQLPSIERYGLVDDTWAAVLAGTSSGEEFMDLAASLASEETDVAVWRRLTAGFDQLDRVLGGAARASHRERVRNLVAPALERLSWDPDPAEGDRNKELRGVLIGALAVLGDDPDAQAKVRDLFAGMRGGSASVEANVAGAVIRSLAAFATDDELDQLIEGFRNGATPQEEQRYLFSLAEVSDHAQMRRVLDLAAGAEVRSQNAPFLLSACMANRDHGALAWALIRDRWAELNDRFPSNSIVRMLSGVRVVDDPDLATEIEEFLAEHPVPQGRQTLEQHLERMRVTVALARREGAAG